MNPHNPKSLSKRKLAAESDFCQRYLPLVERCVAKYRAKLPCGFEAEELTSAGRVGLVIAARTWDPTKAPKTFGRVSPEEAWAWQMITCEILNHLGKRGRSGTNWMWQVSRLPLPVTLPAPNPEDATAEAPRVLELRQAQCRLPPLQRKLLELIYDGGHSLRKIGRDKMLGIGWRRVQAEHAAALAALKRYFEEGIHGGAGSRNLDAAKDAGVDRPLVVDDGSAGGNGGVGLQPPAEG